MIKLLIIEYFSPNRMHRKRFWEKLKEKYSKSDLEISICPQDLYNKYYLCDSRGNPFPLDDYKLVLIHRTNDGIPGACQSYTMIARQEGKPYVCYGDGIKKLGIFNLEKCQIEIPLKYLEERVLRFFDRIVQDAQITNKASYIITNYNPLLESTLNFLYELLSLDIALQLAGNLDLCKTIAKSISDKKDIWFSQLPTNAAIDLQKKDLFSLIDKAMGVNSSEELSEIFGFIDESENKVLKEDKFHRTYENLRDCLLDSIMEK